MPRKPVSPPVPRHVSRKAKRLFSPPVSPRAPVEDPVVSEVTVAETPLSIPPPEIEIETPAPSPLPLPAAPSEPVVPIDNPNPESVVDNVEPPEPVEPFTMYPQHPATHPRSVPRWRKAVRLFVPEEVPGDVTRELPAPAVFSPTGISYPSARSVLVVSVLSPNSSGPMYKGRDLHAYTENLRQQLPEIIPALTAHHGNFVSDEQWGVLFQELFRMYGAKPAFARIHSFYHRGAVLNPELPGLNSAVVLWALWQRLKALHEPTSYAHFGETLDQIGTTCLAGITDRLLADWIAMRS